MGYLESTTIAQRNCADRGEISPGHHGDPFDRLLIAQARLEGLTVVTSDAAFDDYDVKVLDART